MWEQIVAWGSSIVLSIGIVWKLVEKYGPKVRKAAKIAEEVLDLTNTLLDAMEDRKITKEEVELLAAKANELQEVLK